MMIKKQVGRTISLVSQGVGHRITLQGMMKTAASCKPLGALAAEPVRRLNSLDFVAVDGHETHFPTGAVQNQKSCWHLSFALPSRKLLGNVML